MVTVNWNQLGDAKKAGQYVVSNIGNVSITDADIAEAAKCGNRCRIAIQDILPENLPYVNC
jgi:exosome complex RNA-binding protein Rrp42 (RNase PH superfamily)